MFDNIRIHGLIALKLNTDTKCEDYAVLNRKVELQMIDVNARISQIEKLIIENTAASITYAALECRLAIEQICYERLRLVHDYIAHEDLKKWQPSEIVKTLINEVEPHVAETYTISISREVIRENSEDFSVDSYEQLDWVPFGTHIGFSTKKLGKLWHSLANLALHIEIPTTKDAQIKQYGNIDDTKAKVKEALIEIKRISCGTLMSSGMGEEIYFYCYCGKKNRRRREFLKDGQILNCVNPNCSESYKYLESDMHFVRRKLEIVCQGCEASSDIPEGLVEKLKYGNVREFACDLCGEKNLVALRPMQLMKAKQNKKV